MNVDPGNPVGTTFHEVQQFRQAWLWLLLFALAGLFWYLGINQLFLSEPWGGRPAATWVIVLV